MKKNIIMLGIIIISVFGLLSVLFYIKTKDIKYISSNEINEYTNISMTVDNVPVVELPKIEDGHFYYRIDANNTRCEGGSVSWSNISYRLKVKVTSNPLKCKVALVKIKEDYNIVAMYVDGIGVNGTLPAGNYYLDTNATKCYNSSGTVVEKTVTYDNDTRDITVSNITEPVFCEVYLKTAYQVEVFVADSYVTDGIVLSNLILPLASPGTNNWESHNWPATISYSNGVATITPTAQFGGYLYMASIESGNSTTGNVLYSRASIKATNPAVYWVFANDAFQQGTAGITGNNTWELASGLITVTKKLVVNEPTLYFKTQDDRSSGWDAHYLKEPMAINLTDTFGPGNEPSKAFMDRMPYFEYVGGYKNSYNTPGTSPTFNLTPANKLITYSPFSYISATYSSVSCTNGQTATVTNNILTISNLSNNTVCTVYYSL